MPKCEMVGCENYSSHKIGFVGHTIGTCDDHLDIMMDRNVKLTNQLNLIRLEFVRQIVGKIPYQDIKV